MSQANIAKNRHLQNLDTAVSGINNDSNGSDVNAAALNFSAAVLDNDLDWETFANTVNEIKGGESVESGFTFRGIQDSKLTLLDGSGKTISNLTIKDGNQSEKNSGLFRTVSINLAVSNLTLKNPSVQTAGANANAGGLVGMHSDGTLTIDNVGVLYDDNNSAAITASGGNGNAGGLVGMSRSSLSITDSVVAGKNMTVTSDDSASAGGLVGAHSAGTFTITNSAAAVYVQGGIAAGGVIGSADSAQGSEITKTYAGGHTVKCRRADRFGWEFDHQVFVCNSFSLFILRSRRLYRTGEKWDAHPGQLLHRACEGYKVCRNLLRIQRDRQRQPGSESRQSE